MPLANGTTISVPKELREELEGLKESDWEPIYAVILRIVHFYKKHHKRNAVKG